MKKLKVKSVKLAPGTVGGCETLINQPRRAGINNHLKGLWPKENQAQATDHRWVLETTKPDQGPTGNLRFQFLRFQILRRPLFLLVWKINHEWTRKKWIEIIYRRVRRERGEIHNKNSAISAISAVNKKEFKIVGHRGHRGHRERWSK